jgi:hypothetical protein
MALIGHDVAELANIDDAFTVGRNLRIAGQLEVEDIEKIKLADFRFGPRCGEIEREAGRSPVRRTLRRDAWLVLLVAEICWVCPAANLNGEANCLNGSLRDRGAAVKEFRNP